MKKVLKWIAIIFVILIVIGVILAPDKNTSDASISNSDSTANNTDEVQSPPIEVTATELLNAYKNNEVGANQQYKGKNLLVTAQIDAIQAGISDEPYLSLKAGGEFEFNKPQAHMAKSEYAKAASLSKGQSIKLLCVGNSEVAGTPMLKDCVIQ